MGNIKMKNKERFNTFLIKAKEKHNNIYDYSKVVYINGRTKIIISCSIHGDFEQTPEKHLSGQGCPTCANEKRAEQCRERAFDKDKGKLTKEKFIERAKEVHKDFFSYNKIQEFPNNIHSKVTITCPIHGDFVQSINEHLNHKAGCKKCQNKGKISLIEFKEKANEIYSSKYDYSKTTFTKLKDKVTITCPIHGDFEQIAANHLKGINGCDQCLKIKKSLNKDDFLFYANKVHNGKYTYNNINNNSFSRRDKIFITCPIHGDFIQNVHNHLQGCGCTKCSAFNSAGELEITKFLNSINIKFKIRKKFETENKSSRNARITKELDIFIPEFNLGIEYNDNFWHSEKFKPNNYHLEKTQFFNNIGIKVLHIYSHQWINKKEIVKSIILNKINSTPYKLYARKCEIKKIDNMTEEKFLNKNHLQGYANSAIALGAFYEGELVALMSFGKSRFESGKIELIRFAVKINNSIIGIASKLFKHYLNNYWDKTEIVSYCDISHFSGDLYKNLGFTEEGYSSPSYSYFHISNVNKIFSRQQFQKHKLEKLLMNYDADLTEKQNAEENGFYRLYNCGNLKFRYKKTN